MAQKFLCWFVVSCLSSRKEDIDQRILIWVFVTLNQICAKFLNRKYIWHELERQMRLSTTIFSNNQKGFYHLYQ